ncbi:MAG TPA: hypothetical protein VNN20_01905 [Thermodesulfobacteriota bacterium]|nr:hypothetical protein [Thermodesulfobacteriota bacterium]
MAAYKDFPFLHFTERRTDGNPFALSPFDVAQSKLFGPFRTGFYSAAHPEPVEGERQAQGRPVEGCLWFDPSASSGFITNAIEAVRK